MKLTAEQAEMLALCLETGAAWTTSPVGKNAEMLDGLVALGWFSRVDPPAPILVSYALTDAGREALAARQVQP